MKLFRRLRFLFRKGKLDTDMAEEMRLHVELQTERNIAAGMKPDEARYAALRQFGNIASVQERAREGRGWLWVGQFWQDLRIGVRSLARSPGFSLAAIGMLALGIGTCAGVYSVIDGLLLHPVGSDPHPEREVKLTETRPPQGEETRVSPANYFDWERRTESFSFIRAGTGGAALLTGAGEPRRIVAGHATHDFLRAHTWTLALGRGFLPEEETPGRDKVVIVSHRIWQTQLGGGADALGRTLWIDGQPREVIGVISEEIGRFSAADAWMPLALTGEERAQRGTRRFGVWARLKPGVSVAAAQTEMNLIAAQLAHEHPETNAGWGVSVVPVTAFQGKGGLRQALWTLLGAVGCVLLIACANVANLLLARASVRQREIAVRAALGAGRGRLMRQLLAESLVLALLGGAGGVLLAHWGLQAVHAYAGPGMERLPYIELNATVLGGSVALSIATGLVFGLAPAWLGSRVDLNDALKQGARGAGGGAPGRLRHALVIVEVALALVLLAGAGGLVRRLAERARLDPGFVPEGATVLQLNLPRAKYPDAERLNTFISAVLERLRAVPGVAGAEATTALPVEPPEVRFEVEGRPPRPRPDWPAASAFSVTPGYFSTLGIRLVRGRVFTAHDDARGTRVAVVSETFARQFFPGEDPIGRRIVTATGNSEVPREIVGVVGDVTQFGADAGVPPQVYLPYAQSAGLNLAIVVRVRGDPTAVVPLLKPQIYAVDANQPVSALRALTELLDERVAGQRFAMHLLTVFSAIALLIAAVGIYAVIAYAVSQRRMEIGIRLALGAEPGDVVRLVLAFGARVIGLGLVMGVAAALATGRTVEAMLYRVDARDPLTLGAITLLLGAVSLLACWLPARRAAKVDPMVALRAE